MADILISYAREDRDWVQRLARSLEAMGWSIWWDRRIPTGQVFWKVVQRELATARCVMVVWSRAALDSDFVIEEAGQGRDRKVLVPVFREMVLPPLGFGAIQSANLSAWNGQASDPDFQSLMHDVAALIGKPADCLKEKPPEPEGDGKNPELDKGQERGKPDNLHPKESLRSWLKCYQPWVISFATILVVAATILSLLPLDRRAESPEPESTDTSSTTGQLASSNLSVRVSPEPFEFAQRNQQSGLEEYVHKATGIPFVPVPGDTFQMGSPETEAGREADESPLHKVVVGPFLISKYEVTQAQWQKVMGNNPSLRKRADLPVENVSWLDCMEFCRKTGLALPTEAQWEYACRAGTTGAYGGTGILDEMGWHSENSGGTTQVAGKKKPNHFGLYDMHGNVWEWTRSLYRPYPSRAEDGRDDVDAHGKRVLRGGSFRYGARSVRCADRESLGPDLRGNYVGFRVVASPF